jgi:hypothetical protein
MSHANDAHSLGVTRLAATGGISAGLMLVLCWIGTFLPVSGPTHAFVGLFTIAETQSVTALAEGTLWSLLFGTVAGAVLASVYNLLAGLDRRT